MSRAVPDFPAWLQEYNARPENQRIPSLPASNWPGMSRREVATFIAENGDAISEAHAKLTIAVAEFGAVLRATGAHEQRAFEVERFVRSILAEVSGHMPEEITEWLEKQVAGGQA